MPHPLLLSEGRPVPAGANAVLVIEAVPLFGEYRSGPIRRDAMDEYPGRSPCRHPKDKTPGIGSKEYESSRLVKGQPSVQVYRERWLQSSILTHRPRQPNITSSSNPRRESGTGFAANKEDVATQMWTMV